MSEKTLVLPADLKERMKVLEEELKNTEHDHLVNVLHNLGNVGIVAATPEVSWETGTSINVKDKALVFVQHEMGNKWTLYKNGKEVKGLRYIDISAYYDDATTDRLEFVTGADKEEN